MLAVILALILFWLPLPAIAAPSLPGTLMAQFHRHTPAQMLERLFKNDAVQADWFVPPFLQQVPLEQVQGLVDELQRSLGALQSIESVPEGFELHFERGRVPASIRLTAEGKINRLFFGVPEVPISLAEAVTAFQNFPGEASLLVLEDNTVLAEVNPDQPLAVGSVFKLAVLAAVQEAIANSTLNWTDVVTLQPEWKSLPSGILQDWPAETSLTIETLATLMISLSDNTATDALMAIVGRENVEALAAGNQPFLTTREAFVLKNPDNTNKLNAFRRGNVEQRRQLLPALAKAPLPEVSLFGNTPLALDVEWHFSARELCILMSQVQELPLMGINPGAAQAKQWQKITYKGGSEPGVLSMITGLVSTQGTSYCVVATVNSADQPVNDEAFIQLYTGVILGLEERSQSART